MPSQTRARVLYVDDDNDSREMLSTLLAILRIEVTAVATAESAISLIDAERFDVYLLDAWLPGTDGFELCRLIRKTNPTKPVLFFSGAAHETDIKRGLDAGASAYVCKPDVRGLLGTISQVVPSSHGLAA